MKKFLSLIIAIAMLICVFAACSNDNNLEKADNTEKIETKETTNPDDKVLLDYHVNTEPFETEEIPEWFLECINNYSRLTKFFSDDTLNLLDSCKELTQEEFIEEWNKGNGSWWNSAYSSILSLKNIYTEMQAPNSVSAAYRDRIFTQCDDLLTLAQFNLRVRLGFDPVAVTE